LPAIGRRTIKVANEAGLGGIAIAANEVIILLRSQTVQAADRAGLFLKGVPRL